MLLKKAGSKGNKTEISNTETVLVLDNIRSVHNVGAIFRTADAASVSRIYLVGQTPAPIDRFGRKRGDFHKSALGAEDFVAWESEKDAFKIVKKLKKEGYFVVGVEQSQRSKDYRKIKINNKKRVFVFGNEITGVGSEVLKFCDGVAEIPMFGRKESLNVSVTAGIILYHFLP